MMRQAAATAIFLFSLGYLIKRKYIKCILLNICTGMIHSSALIYVLFIITYIILDKFILKSKLINLKGIIIISICIFFSSFFIRSFLEFVTASLNIYSGYFGSDQDSGVSSGTHFLFGFTPFITAIITYQNKKLYLKNSTEEDIRVFNLYMTLQWLGFLFSLLMTIIPNGERLIFLFMPTIIISAPFFLNRTSNRYRMLSKLFLISSFIVSMGYYFYVRKSLDMFPYHFIFNKWHWFI